MTSRHLLYGFSLLSLTLGACDQELQPATDPAPEEQALAPVEVSALEAVPAAVTPEAAAASYATRQLAQASPLAGWKVRASKIGMDGRRHVRMIQLHAGIPVEGGDVVVHFMGDQLASISGNPVPGLEELDVTPTIDPAKVRELARTSYLARVTDRVAALAYDREATRLVILPAEGKRAARLAWHLVFHTEAQGGVEAGLWNSFYDAKTGELLRAYNGVSKLSQASGPGGNASISRTWTNALDVEPAGAQYMMDAGGLRTRNMLNNGYVVLGPLNGIGDAAINDAHGFSEITLDMMRNWFGLDSIDDAGQVIVSRVHYGSSTNDDAHWDGISVNYGDGYNKHYATSGDINMVAHEIHHGFTDYHSNLSRSPGFQYPAVDESFSDIAGELAESYRSGAAPDFYVSPDVQKVAAFERSMCNPPIDGSSIDNAVNFSSVLDPHHAAGVMNKAFCLAARRIGSDSPSGSATKASTLLAGRAWFLANESYWTSTTTYYQACQGVLAAARALNFTNAQHEHLRQAWYSVGVNCGSPMEHHDLYVDSSGSIHELYNTGTGWAANRDVTTDSGAPPAASEPFGYSAGYVPYVVFRSSTNELHELHFNGHLWVDDNLTASVGGVGPASAPTAYALGNKRRIFFRGTDGDLHELYYDGVSWVNQNLTTVTHGPPPAGRPYGLTHDGRHQVLFRDANGDVQEVYSNGTSAWVQNNLTNGAVSAAFDPMGYGASNGYHVIFADSIGHVHELYSDGVSAWVDNDLTFLSGGVNGVPAIGAPFGFATGIDHHVVFRAAGNQLHDLFSNGSPWTDINRTVTVGGPGPASDPTGYFSGFVHILFRDANNVVREVFYNGSWANNDLSTAFGGSPPVSGVSGLTSL
jgi:vibriolysin